MKTYYAHSLALYNTPQEARDLETIRAMYAAIDGSILAIINPNDAGIESFCQAVKAAARAEGADPSQRVMDHIFKPMVQSCARLVFRALPGGAIPAGVAQEIAWAQEKNIPVLELPTFIGRRVLTVEETRTYLQEVGER